MNIFVAFSIDDTGGSLTSPEMVPLAAYPTEEQARAQAKYVVEVPFVGTFSSQQPQATPQRTPDPNKDERQYVYLTRTPDKHTPDPAFPDEPRAVYIHKKDALRVDSSAYPIPIYHTAPSDADRIRWNNIKTRERALAKLTIEERAVLGLS